MGAEERDKNNRLLCTIPTIKSTKQLNKTTVEAEIGILGGRQLRLLLHHKVEELALLESLEKRSMGFTLHVTFAMGASRELFLILLIRAFPLRNISLLSGLLRPSAAAAAATASPGTTTGTSATCR